MTRVGRSPSPAERLVPPGVRRARPPLMGFLSPSARSNRAKRPARGAWASCPTLRRAGIPTPADCASGVSTPWTPCSSPGLAPIRNRTGAALLGFASSESLRHRRRTRPLGRSSPRAASMPSDRASTATSGRRSPLATHAVPSRPRIGRFRGLLPPVTAPSMAQPAPDTPSTTLLRFSLSEVSPEQGWRMLPSASFHVLGWPAHDGWAAKWSQACPAPVGFARVTGPTTCTSKSRPTAQLIGSAPDPTSLLEVPSPFSARRAGPEGPGPNRRSLLG